MRRSQKSKSVAWASHGNLCQVRLFCSEESPAQVGLGTQGIRRAKGLGPDDNLSPEFEGIQHAKRSGIKLSQIPLITWRCPPSSEVNSSWRVAAGEESVEMEAQKQREMTVLVAVYPRSSAIPPNPSTLMSADDSIINDQNTPLVPITPIEDEDNAMDTTFGSTAGNTKCTDDKIVATGGVKPDTALAAQVALSLFMSKSYQGNLIDRELLIKILSDPKMVEQLATNHASWFSTQNMSQSSHVANMPPSNCQAMPAIGAHTIPSTSTQSVPNLMSPPKNLFNPLSISLNRRDPLDAHFTRPELITTSMPVNILSLYPPSMNLRPSVPDVAPVPAPGVPKAKDINYYRSLILQHGEERKEILPQDFHHTRTSHEPSDIPNSRDSKQKIRKPCIFFNSSRGCRNGANCAYQHDSRALQRVIGIPEVQSAKRMKISR